LALISSRYFTPALVLRFWTSSVTPGTAFSKAFLIGSVTSFENEVTHRDLARRRLRVNGRGCQGQSERRDERDPASEHSDPPYRFPCPPASRPTVAKRESGLPLSQNCHKRRRHVIPLFAAGRLSWREAVPMLGWFQKLLPKEDKFFVLFERHAQTLQAGAAALGRRP
jgi:hypothetical protein